MWIPLLRSLIASLTISAVTSMLGASITLVALDGLRTQALAGFGSEIQPARSFGLGVVGRTFKRDVYDVEEDALSNPGDSFGYLALEARMGVWADRLDVSLEVARAHNAEDEFPERDYITWEVGAALRGLIYRHPEDRVRIRGGIQYRETVGFDRGETLTHKLRRNLVAFGVFARPFEVSDRRAQGYVGPLYSRHQFFDYGASYRPGVGPGEGETRNNLQLLGGASVWLFPSLELTGEVWFRENLSWGLSALYAF